MAIFFLFTHQHISLTYQLRTTVKNLLKPVMPFLLINSVDLHLQLRICENIW